MELPVRQQDCPALKICSSIGNARENCHKDGVMHPEDLATEKCLVSVIILLGSLVRSLDQGFSIVKRLPDE